MRFSQLHAKNFMRFRDAVLPLSGQGLVLVLGDNQDAPKANSNGSGKSALLDALCWSLWGLTIRGLKHDDVINEDVGKDCEVGVQFADNGVQYKVVRFRGHTTNQKPNDLKLFIDGECDDAAGMDLTQKRINEILGLDFHTFQCMMPGAGVKAAELTDVKIKELLEKLLQTEVLSKAQDIAKAKHKEVGYLEVALDKEIAYIMQQITDTNQTVQQYEAAMKSRADVVDMKRSNLQTELNSLKQQVDTYKQSVTRAVGAKTELVVVTAFIDAKTKIIEDVTSANEAPKQDHATAVIERSSNMAKLELQLQQAEAEVQRLTGLDNTCSSCHQTVTAGHRAVLLENAHKVTSQFRDQLKTKTEYYDNLIGVHHTTCVLNTNRINTVLKDIKELRAQESALLSKVQEGAFAEPMIATLQTSITNNEKHLLELDTDEDPYADLLTTQITRAADLVVVLAAKKTTKVHLETELKALKFWIDGFSAKGLRNYMLRHVTPVLNQSAKKYADILTDGEMEIEFHTERTLKTGKSKDEFHIVVKTAHGASSYTGNSTGERGRADLAISFALGDLAQLRAKKRIPFRFLDEPFENIDDAGHESILSLLQLQQQYDTVYCITHKASFQELFTKHIVVTKKDGISTVGSAE